MDGSSFERAFEKMRSGFTTLAVFAFLGVTLGLWKAVEVVLWVIRHLWE
jgi:uncharacterized membrane protein